MTKVGDWRGPKWLKGRARRIGKLYEESRLPASQEERQAIAKCISRDGSNLLIDLYAAEALVFLREVPAVETLRRIWIQNYVWIEGQICWRDNEDLPPGKRFINSPSDQDARYGKKRETRWTGYKVHLTETCEEDAPHLITHVTTTAAATTDEAMTETIHTDLQQANLTPRQHLLDAGYITAPILVSSQQQGIDVIGLARGDVKWQANTEQGIDAGQFVIDWEQQQATCPEGQQSNSWTPTIDDRKNEIIKIKFSPTVCGRCPRQVHCIRSEKKYKRRTITIRPQAQHEALQAARRRQKIPIFVRQYALREDIEATILEGECVPLACAVPAISVLPKHTCNILSLLPRLIRCVRWHGSIEVNSLLQMSLLSRGYAVRLKKVSQQCQMWARTKFGPIYQVVLMWKQEKRIVLGSATLYWVQRSTKELSHEQLGEFGGHHRIKVVRGVFVIRLTNEKRVDDTKSTTEKWKRSTGKS